MPVTTTGIAYDRTGPAAAQVLLLHAGIADRTMWDPQWHELGDELGLARLDLRGFGQSTVPAAGPWSHAQDVVDTLDELGLERVHVVGASFGAGVAVETALVAPGRVASLLLCPPGGSLLPATDDLREVDVAESAALERGDVDSAVEANVQAWVVGKGRTADDVDPGLVADVRRMQRRAFQVAEALGGREEEELDPPALDRLGEIVAPTLVLLGAHDLDATRAAARRIGAGVRGAAEVTWDDVAHLPSGEQPARFTALLRRHVQLSSH